jgi:5-oxoprolinase (ATP-hydrolysing)
MPIEVWADVGGTFTDCFVVTGRRRLVTKVLSSGVVRAGGLERLSGNQVRLDLPERQAIDEFWVGATLSRLDARGETRPVGTVTRFDGKRRVAEVDGAVNAFSPSSPPTFELDPDLEAPVLAARLLLGVPLGQPLPPLEVRLGTTRGTNALLTRSGAATALLVTEGFGDVLRIGEQDRPDLFALAIRKPSPLTETVVEVDERLDAEGRVLRTLDEPRLRDRLAELRAAGVESLAICLLHAHVNAAHEEICQRLATQFGFREVSRSSEVAPLIKLVSRAETTTLDAYLNPVLAGYVDRVWQQFGGATCRLRLMTSGGNLVAPSGFRGRDSILSGPAGGVVALAAVARSRGVPAAIGVDMGGTSTDVSRFEGRVGRRFETRVSGVRVMTPMMDIHTVAAGGGSICDFRGATSSAGARLTVGPESGGAAPGPACYGRGGPLTLTDVNLLLGRLPESRFPFPLDRAAAQGRLAEVAEKMPEPPPSLPALADGFLQIAVTHMAEAVRAVSTAEGSDVRTMSLVGFGGAAGQHLCRLADVLGMTHIIDHPDASMLSALGMGLADLGRVVTRGVYEVWQAGGGSGESTAARVREIAAELRQEAVTQLREEHDGSTTPQFTLECDVRYVRTESPLQLELEPTSTLPERFHNKHRSTFGYARPERAIELVAVRCEATLRASHAPDRPAESVSRSESTAWIWHDSDYVEARMLDRGGLIEGESIVGPAMIASHTSTLVVEPGWEASVSSGGVVQLRPVVSEAAMSARDDSGTVDAGGAAERIGPVGGGVDHDPVLVEVIARRLQGIADAMGETLRRTAVSVNVKERRDYSCAVFRGDGALIANAPHVPVHLGAMGHTVRRIIEAFPEMAAGDCYISNDPFSGGSHLPDVTVVTPVFCDSPSSDRPDFFVASRAHHAEIGGRTPGSMPPDASCLAEEGVVIRDFALVRNGRSREDALRELLSSGPYPSRNPAENLADVAAQQAAGTHGAKELRRLAERYTVATIEMMMGRLIELAGDSISGWLAALPKGKLAYRDALDDGTPIAVQLRPGHGKLVIDFAGTGPVHRHGFNATRSIVTAAVMYVLRTVTGSELPLCEGVLRDVELVIPPGLLDPPPGPTPETSAAVVAGNVETSQRVVDVLLGALGVAAASQGTMNNLLLGNDRLGYYETIGGGSGATAGHPGADAVHTHMTNTRITDPEVLESRLPIRLWRFAIRRGSGGRGRHDGGCGIVRELEFLQPLTVSLITSRRVTSPYGADGGGAGQPGSNAWIRGERGEGVRRDTGVRYRWREIRFPRTWHRGSQTNISRAVVTELGPTATFEAAAGDRLRIETPGGGGWGEPPRDPR